MAKEDTNTSKKERVEQEFRRLLMLFGGADSNAKQACLPLIQNASYLAITLHDLQSEIDENGVTESYMNGAAQYGVKPSAAMNSYNNLLKVYLSTMKGIVSLLPKEVSADSKLAKFTMDGTDKKKAAREKKMLLDIDSAVAEFN